MNSLVHRSSFLSFLIILALAYLAGEGVTAERMAFPPEWALSWERATQVTVSQWVDRSSEGKPEDLELIVVDCLKGHFEQYDKPSKNPLKAHKKGEFRLVFFWETLDKDNVVVDAKIHIVSVKPEDAEQIQSFKKWLLDVLTSQVRVLSPRPVKGALKE